MASQMPDRKQGVESRGNMALVKTQLVAREEHAAAPPFLVGEYFLARSRDMFDESAQRIEITLRAVL